MPTWIWHCFSRKEQNMPQYEYRCKKCKKEFSVYLSISEKERKKLRCPSCKGSAVEQLITPFMTKTSRKG
jgi:putative FmdB family regulatory protein